MNKNLPNEMISFKTLRRTLYLLVLTAIFIGCVDKNPAIFVEVNGQMLSTDEVVRQFKKSATENDAVSTEKNDLIDFVEKNLLANLLFRADGYQQKLDQMPEVKVAIDLQKRDILIGKNGILYQSIIPKTIAVSETEIRQRYAQCKESVKIAEIIVNGATLADSLYQLLQNGADFAALAKDYSIDLQTSRKAGEDDLYITCGSRSPVFEKNTFRLNPGEMSKPVELADGFHIVKLLDRKQVRQQPFAEIRDTLLSHLQKVKRELFLENYRNSLFSKYDVTINKELLSQLLKFFSASARTADLSNTRSVFPEHPLARYRGGELTSAQFMEFFQALPESKRYLPRRTEDAVAMIRACLTPELLYLDAINRGLDQDVKFFEAMRSIKDRYVEQTYRRKFVDAPDSVSQSEIEGYYGEHYENYKKMDKAAAFKKIRIVLLAEKRQKRYKKLIRKLKKQFIVRYNSQAVKKALEILNAEKTP